MQCTLGGEKARENDQTMRYRQSMLGECQSYHMTIYYLKSRPNYNAFDSDGLALVGHSTMGKVHGSLAQAGKVRNNTPKVPKTPKKVKPVVGRAHLRKLYNKRVLGVNPDARRKVGPNSHSQ
jgi:small subunit ribosomal protein S30e